MVHYYLRGGFQAENIGALAALQRGYYRNADLDVKVFPGTPGMDTITKVEKDCVVAFGTAQDHEIILAYRDRGIQVRAVATDFQIPSWGLAANFPVQRPEDLKGKRVAVTPSLEIPIKVWLGRLAGEANLSLQKEDTFQTLDKKTAGSQGVDVVAARSYYELLKLKRANGGVTFFPLMQTVLRWPENTLFTRKEAIRTHPDTVRSFVRATYQGWSWALGHPEEAMEILSRYNPHLDRALEKEAFRIIASLMITEETRKKGLGGIREETWRSMAARLKGMNLIPQDLEVQQFYHLEFTSRVMP